MQADAFVITNGVWRVLFSLAVKFYQPMKAHVRINKMDRRDTARQFLFSGDYIDEASINLGHINDTYVLSCSQPTGEIQRYLLQKINRSVFKNPPGLMQNITRVCQHLHTRISASGGDPTREALTLIETRDHSSFYHDPAGEFWRAFIFIENARTYETARSQQQIYQAALAFGTFQQQLSDFPVERLIDTIPGFHDTPARFEAFTSAVLSDLSNRAALVKQEIAAIEKREADTRVIAECLSKGEIPLRVVHNDAKINNVMIDDQTGKAICILDLDTVMPGAASFDFGDLVRSAAAMTFEDDPDFNRAGLSLKYFESLVNGYLEATRGFLSPNEIEYLAFSARLITLEQAIRFLTDYLNGDVYYKIHRPGQNLDRARTQISMLMDMEKKFDQMCSLVRKYC